MNTRKERGFTLIEVLVVFGLIAIVGGFVLLMSMDTYRASSYRADRNLLVAILERARAQAVSNLCIGAGCANGKPHGVSLQGSQYVLFQGPSFATRDPSIDNAFEASPLVTRTGLTEVVFSQLSGTTMAGTITLSDASGYTSLITLSADGQITWTN